MVFLLLGGEGKILGPGKTTLDVQVETWFFRARHTKQASQLARAVAHEQKAIEIEDTTDGRDER